MTTTGSHTLYVYDEEGNYIASMNKDEYINHGVNTRRKDVMCNGYNAYGEKMTPKTLSERWSTCKSQTTRRPYSYYESDDESDDESEISNETTMSVQTRSQTRMNNLKPRRLFPVDKMDENWEPSDDENEDPTYETESEDEFDELDEPYEYDNWYYNNYISVN